MAVKVLLADDEQLVRAGLKLILEAEDDIEVVGEAGDGAQAVELTRRLDPDVVLMDVQMPVMDGVEAARTIRAAEVALGGPRIPILALTANALVHQVESYLAAGMDGHVSKPIELTRLYDAIETALASAATARAAAAA